MAKDFLASVESLLTFRNVIGVASIAATVAFSWYARKLQQKNAADNSPYNDAFPGSFGTTGAIQLFGSGVDANGTAANPIDSVVNNYGGDYPAITFPVISPNSTYNFGGVTGNTTNNYVAMLNPGNPFYNTCGCGTSTPAATALTTATANTAGSNAISLPAYMPYLANPLDMMSSFT